MPADHCTWPYTTPEGHTYETPTTYEELCALHDNAALAVASNWDHAEHPPEPTWEMVGLAHAEIKRLSVMRYQLTGSLGEGSTARVWRDGRLLFDGHDLLACQTRYEPPPPPPRWREALRRLNPWRWDR